MVFLGVGTLNSTSPLNLGPEPIAEARSTMPVVGEIRVAMRPLALFSIGHLTIDLYASLVATLQPVLVQRYLLSLTQAGVLGGVFMFSSSILQLAFGLVSDRMNRPVFVLASPLVAGVFLCSLGLADGFPDLLALIFLGGLGIAAFHPQGAAGVAAIARHRRGMVLAVFVTCGTIGHSIGPVFFSMMTERLGLEMLYWAALPGLIVSGILLWGLPARESAATRDQSRFDYEAIRAKWKPLLLHYSIVLLRSVVQVGMAQFMTLYLYRERELSFRHASLGLSAFFASAALGSLMGGSLADRFGSRRVVVSSMIISIPFLALFVGTTGWVSFLGLFIGGCALLLTNPVILGMAQELVPTQESTVSGLIMGFAWGVAGMVFVPLIGWLADRFGLQPLFSGLAVLPLLGALLALRLPKAQRRLSETNRLLKRG